MDEVLLLFILLFIVLVFVTVVGHGIWCLLAALFRAIFDDGNSSSARCTKCGQATPGTRRDLPNSMPTGQTTSSDLFGMSRQLERFRQKGAISQQQFESLKRLVLTEMQAKHAEQSAPPVAVPVSSPAVSDEGIVVLSSTDQSVAGAKREPPVAELARVSSDSQTEFLANSATSSAEVIEAEIVDEPPVLVELADITPQAHPLDRPETREQPRASQSRRTLADLLQAFMEEKNIRWGELLSGLLIVGSAVGLVISLRHTLSNAIPYFPALLFMLGTAAIHLAGNYTLRRWKLESTSRGVLLIATLLIPLNFLAAIVISGTAETQFSVSDPRYWLAVIVGLGSFGTMTYFAARALMRDGWWRLWVAVMGASVSQLLINRLAGPTSSSVQMFLLWLLPAGTLFAATGHQLWRARDWKKLSARRADQLLVLLGVATFSLTPVVALMIYKTSNVAGVLSTISPLVAAFGALLLGHGLLIHLRATSSKLAKTQTVGTTLAVIAGLVLAGSVVLAWPDPALLIAVGLTLFVSLSCLAAVGRMPWLHSCAIAGGALSVLVSVHWAVGHLPGVSSQAQALLNSILTDETSVTFTSLALLVGVAGWWSARSGRRMESLTFLWSSATLAGLGVAVAGITSLSAWPLPSYPLATLVFLVNAAALLLAARYLRVQWVTWSGSLLLLAGLVHAIVLNAPIQTALTHLGVRLARPVVVATLLHAILTNGLSVFAWRRSRSEDDRTRAGARESFAQPLMISALISASSTLPFVIAVTGGHFGVHAVYLLIVALVWLSAALLQRSQLSFAVFQVIATGSLILSVCWSGLQFGWWNGTLTSVSLIAVQLSVLACCCILWNVLRKRLKPFTPWSQILAKSEITVEQVLLRALTIAFALLAILTCMPSVTIQLGGDWTHQWWVTGVADNFALLWIAFGITTAATIMATKRESLASDLVWLLLILFVAPWLAISQLADAGSTITMLCWAMATSGLLCSLIYSLRENLLQLLAQYFRGNSITLSADSLAVIRASVLSFGGLPLLLFTLCQFGLLLNGTAVQYPLVTIAGPLAVAAATLVVFAIRDREPWLMMSGSMTILSGVILGFVGETVSVHGALDQVALIQLVQWSCIASAAYALGWLGLKQLVPMIRSSDHGPLLRCQVGLSVGLLLVIAIGAAVGIISSPATLGAAVAEVGHPLSYIGLGLTLTAVLWHAATRLDRYGIHLIGATASLLGLLVAASMALINTAENLVSYHVLELTQVLVAVAATMGLVVFSRVTVRGLEAVDAGDAGGQAHFSAATVNTKHANLAEEMSQTPTSEQLLQGRANSTADQGEHSALVNRLFRRDDLTVWGSAAGLAAALLALRVYTMEPQAIWCLSVLWTCCAVTIVIGHVRGSIGHAIASLVLVCISTTLSCPSDWHWHIWYVGKPDLLAFWNLVGLSGVAAIWLASTVWRQRGQREEQTVRVHQVVIVGGCVVLTLLTGVQSFGEWLSRAFGSSYSFDPTVFVSGFAALVAAAGLTIGSLWDRRATSPLVCLYALGFPLIFFVLQHANSSTSGTVVCFNLGLAALVIASGFLFSKREALSSLATNLKIPSTVRRGDRAGVWLPIVNLVVSVVAVLLSLTIALTFEERWMRFAASAAPLICGLGFTYTASQVRNELVRLVSILLVATSMVLIGWADIVPSINAAIVLERCVRLLISLSAAATLFLIVARRLSGRSAEWQPTLRKAAVMVGGLAVVVLMVVLGIELATFVPGEGAPVNHPYQILAVGIALAGLVAALIAMACRATNDPLNLSERGRMLYVYAAEAVAALFFAHLYLVQPGWFELVHVRYWPFGLMALAFAGVGVGELFQRLRLKVLAEPLQRTAAFLPLIPVAAFWVLAGHERLSFAASGISYSAVLVVVGMLYVMLSVLRQSFVSAVAAAVAGNAALWVLFHDNAFRIAEHPQFWLIPPALSLLVAAQINRRNLPASTLAAIRYACVLLIYLSSTAEMIIESASQQLWPPMVLAALALIGAFVGIVMRVRAFLYIGSTFVLLSVVSMVWHAARAIGEVWPWWAFGMVTGLFILAVFGLVELKRSEVTRLIDRLRQWDR